MKARWILLALATLLLASIAVRENLILREISSTQTSLMSQLKETMGSAQSLERLSELRHSQQVFQRYLQPVILRVQTLAWPFFRSQMTMDWKNKVHQEIDDSSYTQALKLEEKTHSELKALQERLDPSVERLVEVAKTTENLASHADRIQKIQEELNAIQNFSNQIDIKIMSELQGSGKQALLELSNKISGMEEMELSQYLSSSVYFQEVQLPVMQKIFELRKSSLRADTWKEFQQQVRSRLQRQVKKLARAKGKQTNIETSVLVEPRQDSLADLLKKEYDKQIDEETVSQTRPAPDSPSGTPIFEAEIR